MTPRIYFAGHQADSTPAPAAPTGHAMRVLLSYHYYKDKNIDDLLEACFGGTGVEVDVFADSGAWTAWAVGKPVDPAEYTAWVMKWKHRFTCVCAPDVIGDPDKTLALTSEMLGVVTGLPVLPVFHVGEDWKYLTRCLELGDYIALGGMVPYTRNKPLLHAWLAKVFKQVPSSTRVHGFGMTTWPLLCEFPWYSVDSSSWTSSFRYAQLALFDQDRGQWEAVNMASSKSLLQNMKLLRSYGMSAQQATAGGYDRSIICAVSVASWQRAEDWLSKRKQAQASASKRKAGCTLWPVGRRQQALMPGSPLLVRPHARV